MAVVLNILMSLYTSQCSIGSARGSSGQPIRVCSWPHAWCRQVFTSAFALSIAVLFSTIVCVACFDRQCDVLLYYQHLILTVLLNSSVHTTAACRPFNLTTRGIQSCVAKVVATARPLLILGGGGYCPTATARLWTVLTATAIGEDTAAGLNES
jgi:hypothetical protein